MIACAALWICAPLFAAPPVEIITASFFGPAGECDLEAAALGPDGSIYLAGNASAPAKDLPGGIAPKTFGAGSGADPKGPGCGCGFVARLSGDGKRL
ncbi:MAG: hypothetical protein JXP34_21480, partial [Planctomycetes bacterium]|nr:hypothetical protein [Planctomycetota bacterium]